MVSIDSKAVLEVLASSKTPLSAREVAERLGVPNATSTVVDFLRVLKETDSVATVRTDDPNQRFAIPAPAPPVALRGAHAAPSIASPAAASGDGDTLACRIRRLLDISGAPLTIDEIHAGVGASFARRLVAQTVQNQVSGGRVMREGWRATARFRLPRGTAPEPLAVDVRADPALARGLASLRAASAAADRALRLRAADAIEPELRRLAGLANTLHAQLDVLRAILLDHDGSSGI